MQNRVFLRIECDTHLRTDLIHTDILPSITASGTF